MLEKHMSSNINSQDGAKFKCSKCGTLVNREDYVHDDKICRVCFEKEHVESEASVKE